VAAGLTSSGIGASLSAGESVPDAPGGGNLFESWLFESWLFESWLFESWLFESWLFGSWLFEGWLFRVCHRSGPGL